LDAARYQRVKAVLVEALALPSQERTAYLDRACGADADLRAEVEDLLRRESSPARLVEEGVSSVADLTELFASEEAPTRIGRYEILGVLGEGGMGVVYHGRQHEPIVRDVAVKVLRRGLDTARLLERFQWERRSLARMDHPHIARILDAGSDDAGRPFVVLEKVDGEPVTRWCDERRLPLAERIGVMELTARAVQHAHDRGVLHRDLKPGNVLVREVDGRAVPKVIDFGIAKALDPGDDDLTQLGQQVGTPAYMSPEQRAGDPGAVDVRSDVYALGVMLYELLTGVRPWGDDPDDRTLPPAPSRRAAKDAPVEPGRLRGDLDRIALKAVHPDPERRYASAAALADDLERWRLGRPVSATPDSLGYRLRMSGRRNPVAVAVLGAALVFVVAGVGFLAYHARRLDQERRLALAAEETARREAAAAGEIAGFLQEMLTETNPETGDGADLTALELLRRGAARLDTELTDQPLVRGRLLSTMAAALHGMARHEEADTLARRGLASFQAVPDTAVILRDLADTRWLLGTILHDRSLHAEAEAQTRAALDLARRTRDADPQFPLDVAVDLAISVQGEGRVQEAIELLRGVERDAAALGPEGERTMAAARNILGYIFYQTGDWKEAAVSLSQALATLRTLEPPDDLELANTLNNLAGIKKKTGHPDEAEALFAESLAIFQLVYQQEHTTYARAFQHLGGIALERGDLARADSLITASVDITLRLLGREHPYTAGSLLYLGKLRHAQGRDAEAETAIREAVAIRARTVGPDHYRTRIARAELGKFLLETGRLAEAEAELSALVRDEAARLPDTHPELNELKLDLAETLLEEGRPREARPLLREALPKLRAALDDTHPDVIRCRDLLVRAEP